MIRSERDYQMALEELSACSKWDVTLYLDNVAGPEMIDLQEELHAQIDEWEEQTDLDRAVTALRDEINLREKTRLRYY